MTSAPKVIIQISGISVHEIIYLKLNRKDLISQGQHEKKTTKCPKVQFHALVQGLVRNEEMTVAVSIDVLKPEVKYFFNILFTF